MRTVNMREAKAQFLKLIEAVAQGEKIVIGMADRPVAILLPYRIINLLASQVR